VSYKDYYRFGRNKTPASVGPAAKVVSPKGGRGEKQEFSEGADFERVFARRQTKRGKKDLDLTLFRFLGVGKPKVHPYLNFRARSSWPREAVGEPRFKGEDERGGAEEKSHSQVG